MAAMRVLVGSGGTEEQWDPGGWRLNDDGGEELDHRSKVVPLLLRMVASAHLWAL
jgi:hypothetical protein